jgi:predicted component of viral defense system (DUF524 family)
MIEFIETVLLYKFPQMSREEVEAMFTLGDLKKIRVYRDALQEEKVSDSVSSVVSSVASLRVKRSGRSVGKFWD